MPGKPAATSRSMHNLEIFTKNVLLYMLCAIHPCPCLHFYPAVDCCYYAPKLLNNVAVSVLTWSSVLPCVLLVIHTPYDYAIAILSFIIMPSYCWMPSHAMKCFVMSDLSSQRCLHNSVYAMLSFSAVWICLWNLLCLHGCHHIFCEFLARDQ